MAFIYTKLFKGYETHHKNKVVKESKPRLSPHMALLMAKNLMLRLDIETLVLHPDSPESDRIRDKYMKEITKRNEREQLTRN